MTSASQPDSLINQYAPAPTYRFIFILCLGLALLFAWELWRVVTIGALLFLLISLALALWAGRALTARVQLTANGLCRHSLLQTPHCVEFRQLVGVSEEGRFNLVLVLTYHPMLDNGLLDLDAIQTLMLPAVRQQETLLAQLRAKLPV
jgi:hypothetical protein